MSNLDRKIEEVERKIQDIKARWPLHSPKVPMVQELENLEIELKELKEEKKNQAK